MKWWSLYPQCVAFSAVCFIRLWQDLKKGSSPVWEKLYHLHALIAVGPELLGLSHFPLTNEPLFHFSLIMYWLNIWHFGVICNYSDTNARAGLCAVRTPTHIDSRTPMDATTHTYLGLVVTRPPEHTPRSFWLHEVAITFKHRSPPQWKLTLTLCL